MNASLELCIPTEQYRSMPIPGHTFNGKPTKIASCFVRATDIPSDLEDWMGVNPRMPARKRDREELTGRVARRIVKTLQEDPSLFALKNQGIYILVAHAEHFTEKGGVSCVKLRLTNKEHHGIANGGHTYFAIRSVVDDDEASPPVDAWVRLHILEYVNPDLIIELAEGLNRSVQVDDASLHNLEGKFNEIKAALAGKPGADRISYKMGEHGDVEVTELLTWMTALNLDLFPDEAAKHPNTLFGQPTKVLNEFSRDVDHNLGNASAYRRMLPRLHEILVLRDRVVEECARFSQAHPRLALLGKKRGKDNQKKRPTPAVFAAGRSIDRRVFIGLVYPIFAAFRANIRKKAWDEGRLEWIVDPEDLLAETIDPLCDVVRRAYEDYRGKPAEVGKKEAAYLACYQVVLLKLARQGKLAADS